MAKSACSVGECDKPVRARLMCTGHYQRWRKGADPAEVNPYGRKSCRFPGCSGQHFGLGYCGLHYGRLKRHGDPANALIAPRIKTGPQNHQWKGDDLRYRSAHDRVEHRYGYARALACAHCGGQAADWAYDHADPNEMSGPNGPSVCRYSADPDHYMPLCRPCHKAWDRTFRQGAGSH